MLIKGSDYLYSLRAMVNLMEMSPEEVDRVSPSVPPVKNEGGDEIGDEASCYSIYMAGKMKKRIGRKPFLPGESSKGDDAELDEVNCQHPNCPGGNSWKFPSRHEPFDEEAAPEDYKDDDEHGQMLGKVTNVEVSAALKANWFTSLSASVFS
jgi:hypothetical protein